MADAAIPPYDKRQSTGKKKTDSKKLKRGESEEEKAKRQSTGKKKQASKKLKRRESEEEKANKMQSTGKKKQASKKLKCGESDEERAYEAILKLRTVYKEEELDVREFRHLVMKFKDDYFTDKFVWKKLVEYILSHLPTVIKNGGISRLPPDYYDGWDDEDRLVDIYLRGRGLFKAPIVNGEEVPEVFPPAGPESESESGSDAGKPGSESDED